MPNLQPVTLQHNGASFEMVPYGLTLRRLLYAGKDLLVGPEDATELPAQGHHYRNTVVGRYCNRLPAQPHTLPRTGATTFTPEAQSPGVALHGGPNGFDTRDWTQISREASSFFNTSESGQFAPVPAEALFALDSPHGDQGYPGAVRIEALYQLKDAQRPRGQVQLDMAFRAALVDDATAATPLNLTQHTGYTLATPDSGPDDLTDHILWLKSTQRVQLDPQTACATGSVETHPFNFKQQGGQDLGYVTKNGSVDDNILIEPHEDDEVVAELTHKQWPYTLQFLTNQSSVMAYAGNFFDEANGTRKALHQRPGQPQAGYPKHGAIFLEFHQPVGTLLHPELQSHAGTDTLLKAGDVLTAWHSTIIADKDS